jgi:DegV family protein with EDD domain
MGVGLLAQMGADLAARGVSAAEMVRIFDRRVPDLDVYMALDTLEYLKRGGRISGARAAIGTLLSVKPIITLRDGIVDTVDRVCTTSKARERVLELLLAKPIERLAVLHTTNADADEFAARARATSGLAPDAISVKTVGPSVGPHLGPGCVGAAVLYERV